MTREEFKELVWLCIGFAGIMAIIWLQAICAGRV